MNHRRLLVVAASTVLLAAAIGDAGAQVLPSQSQYQGVIESIRTQTATWQTTFVMVARWLFLVLATMQFAFTNGMLALKGGDASDFIRENTRWLLGTGIMLVFLLHSYVWSSALVKGFRQIGELAVPGVSLDPASIFQAGLEIGALLMSQTSFNPATAVGIMLTALVLLVCFCFVAALIAVAMVESYIVIGASAVFLGFGGAQWTSDIARRTMMYAVSVGAKLFVMELIVGLAMQSVRAWVLAFQANSDNAGALNLLGLMLLIAFLVKMIPDIVQGILSGSSLNSAGIVGGTVAAAAAAGAAGFAAGKSAVAGALSGGGGGAAAGATSGAQGAATMSQLGAQGAGEASSHFKDAAGHMGRMSAHLVETGSGINTSAAFGPFSGVGRGGGEDAEQPEKPAPPESPQANGHGGASGMPGPAATPAGKAPEATPSDPAQAGAGGTIRGAGPGTGSPSGGATPRDAAGVKGGESGERAAPAQSTVAAEAATPQAAPLESSGAPGSPATLDERSTVAEPPAASGSAQLASAQLAAAEPAGVGAAPAGFSGGEPVPLDARAGEGSAAASIGAVAAEAPPATPGAAAGHRADQAAEQVASVASRTTIHEADGQPEVRTQPSAPRSNAGPQRADAADPSSDETR